MPSTLLSVLEARGSPDWGGMPARRPLHFVTSQTARAGGHVFPRSLPPGGDQKGTFLLCVNTRVATSDPAHARSPSRRVTRASWHRGDHKRSLGDGKADGRKIQPVAHMQPLRNAGIIPGFNPPQSARVACGLRADLVWLADTVDRKISRLCSYPPRPPRPRPRRRPWCGMCRWQRPARICRCRR